MRTARIFAFTPALPRQTPLSGRSSRSSSSAARHTSTAMATTAELTFYDSGSCPYAHRAWLALEEKKLVYKTVKVDLQNRTEEFKELHRAVIGDPTSNGKVPILIDGDTTLIESTPIVEYLDHRYPNEGVKLLPDDPVLRYKVKLFTDTFTEKVSIFPLLRASTKAEFEEGKAKLVAGLKAMDKFLQLHAISAEPGYFLGDQYSFAETITTPFLRRLYVALPHVRDADPQAIVAAAGLTRFDKWAKAALDRPSNKETGPSDQELSKGWEKFTVPIKDA